MSFAIWIQAPPFGEAEFDIDGKWTGAGLNPGELIYFQAADGSWQHFDPKKSQVPAGAKFCVTDQGAPTQQQVDAVMNQPPPGPTLEEKVAALQAAAGLTDAQVMATVTTASAPKI